jgi:hypothetical protein
MTVNPVVLAYQSTMRCPLEKAIISPFRSWRQNKLLGSNAIAGLRPQFELKG